MARCANGAKTFGVGADWLNGQIDEVGIWDRALTDAEVLDLFNNRLGIPYNIYTQINAKTLKFNLLGVTPKFGVNLGKTATQHEAFPTKSGPTHMAEPPVRTAQQFDAVIAQGAPVTTGGSGDDSPGIAEIHSTDSTHVHVTFEHPAIDNAILRDPTSYYITPTLPVYTVTPEAVTNPTYVVLTTDEQLDGQEYELDLIRLKKA
jgi:hypothetical protein